ncbi:MAG: hypothetical protein MZV63_16865 [Marinilabiliales bacterium]|nr:hypothetical protein [Marinilabiliales bacterium]
MVAARRVKGCRGGSPRTIRLAGLDCPSPPHGPASCSRGLGTYGGRAHPNRASHPAPAVDRHHLHGGFPPPTCRPGSPPRGPRGERASSIRRSRSARGPSRRRANLRATVRIGQARRSAAPPQPGQPR